MQNGSVFGGKTNTYAVTRLLTLPGPPDAIPDPNNPPNGAISVVDEHNVNTLKTPDIARFMIVSHGINRQGAYTTAGVRPNCPSAGNVSEGENCDDDQTFLISAVYEGIGPVSNDDFAINDMTTNAAPNNPIDNIIKCNAKKMFYIPTDPAADADGCVGSTSISVKGNQSLTYDQLVVKGWRTYVTGGPAGYDVTDVGNMRGVAFNSDYYGKVGFTIPGSQFGTVSTSTRQVTITSTVQAFTGAAVSIHVGPTFNTCSEASSSPFGVSKGSTTCTFTIAAGQTPPDVRIWHNVAQTQTGGLPFSGQMMLNYPNDPMVSFSVIGE